MAIIRFLTTLKNSILAPIRTAINVSGPGTCKLYTGTIPADADTAITSQVLLGTLTFSADCGTVSAGALTMAAITQDSSADATGTATWARLLDGAGATVMDIDVTTTGGGGTLQLNTTNIVAGGPILISSFVITAP